LCDSALHVQLRLANRILFQQHTYPVMKFPVV